MQTNRFRFIDVAMGSAAAAPFSERVKRTPEATRVLRNQTPRPITSLRFEPPIDRDAVAIDTATGERKTVVMFGANNYLGLWSHPYVREQVRAAVDRYGTGGGGSPWVNGRFKPQQELEDRLAALKRTEATIVFSSAYAANVGVGSSLPGPADLMLYDEGVHPSFRDGMALAAGQSTPYAHHDLDALASLLAQKRDQVKGDIFVAAQGVHALEGTLVPLDELVALCTKYHAFLILDDVHSFGVEGPTGRGTAEQFGLESKVDLTTSTFSTIFGVGGAFVSGSRAVIDYLQLAAHPYVFSSSISPIVVATVLAGLDVLEKEPDRLQRLRDNVRYLAQGLDRLGLSVNTRGGLVTVHAPADRMNVDKLLAQLWESSIFTLYLRAIVPPGQERFRINVSANHTRADLDQLIECMETIWATCWLGDAPADQNR